MIEISGSKYMVKGKNNRDKIALEKGHIKRGGKKTRIWYNACS